MKTCLIEMSSIKKKQLAERCVLKDNGCKVEDWSEDKWSDYSVAEVQSEFVNVTYSFPISTWEFSSAADLTIIINYGIIFFWFTMQSPIFTW